jgi:hypothetical protein
VKLQLSIGVRAREVFFSRRENELAAEQAQPRKSEIGSAKPKREKCSPSQTPRVFLLSQVMPMDLPVTSTTKRYQVFLSIITKQAARLNVVDLPASRFRSVGSAIRLALELFDAEHNMIVDQALDVDAC